MHSHIWIHIGASVLVTFTVGLEAIQLHDRAGNGVLFAGEYKLEFTNGGGETVVARMKMVLNGGARQVVLDRFRL